MLSTGILIRSLSEPGDMGNLAGSVEVISKTSLICLSKCHGDSSAFTPDLMLLLKVVMARRFLVEDPLPSNDGHTYLGINHQRPMVE